MSRQIKLVPELQELFDDFISVRERFVDLAEAFAAQQIKFKAQQIELENAKTQISAMRLKQTEDEAIVKSYNQLKIDYELMHLASENHREEIHTENKKRVRDLEEELRVARAKSLQQAESHQTNVTQIVADYEAKLRTADEKIRQLNKTVYDTPRITSIGYPEDTPSAFMKKPTAASRGSNKKWPKLAVEIGSKASTSRGRGRGRGGSSKRKLYTPNDDRLIDLD